MIVAEKSPSLRFRQALESAGLAPLLDSAPGNPPSRAQLEALTRPENLLLTANLAHQRRLALWGSETTYCQWGDAHAPGVVAKAPGGLDWAGLLDWARHHAGGLGPEPREVLRLAAAAGLPSDAAARQLAAAGLGALAPTPLPDAADETWPESLLPFAAAGLELSVAIGLPGDGQAQTLVDHLYQLRRWQASWHFVQSIVPLPAAAGMASEETEMATGMTLLQGLALCRLVLDNVPHVSAAWPRLGVKPAQIALSCGADDWLGTADVTPDDASGPMTVARTEELITVAGLTPVARSARFPQRRSR